MVNVILPVKQSVVTIPQIAIAYTLYGNSVFVVQKDNTVKQIYVTVGEIRSDQASILKGLTAGEQVVTQGQIKLHNGSSIKVVPAPKQVTITNQGSGQ